MSSESDSPTESANDPIEITQRQETIPMEVHHHSSAHGSKKVLDYFWEFLMLFLAVFCGFLAEYQLEHVIEHQKEKSFMNSLTEDLHTDVTTLAKYSAWKSEVNTDFDSLLYFLSLTHPDQHAWTIHQKANRSILRFGLPEINEGTIQQLKNAGGLRLIRNKDVVTAINKHYLLVARMRSIFETERMIRIKLVETSADVLDATQSMHKEQRTEPGFSIAKDKPEVNRFMNLLLAAKSLNNTLIASLDSTRISSLRLKGLIENEYQIRAL